MLTDREENQIKETGFIPIHIIERYEGEIGVLKYNLEKAKKRIAELERDLASEVPKGYLTKAEAAKYCNMSTRKISEHMSARRIAYIQPDGGKVLFKQGELDKFMKRQTIEDKY